MNTILKAVFETNLMCRYVHKSKKTYCQKEPLRGTLGIQAMGGKHLLMCKNLCSSVLVKAKFPGNHRNSLVSVALN